MSFIDIRGLSHKFNIKDKDGNKIGENWAIKDVDFLADRGEMIAILGRNGSGKSTFARHLNGLLAPHGGSIVIGGKDLASTDNLMAVRRQVGMVFQNPDNQIISNVVEEDVGFGPENIGVPTEEIWKRVEKSLKAVGMTAYRKSSPNHLSGGQKQRVAIAGIMAMKPKCIILDEPTAMLDPVGGFLVLFTVTELNKKEGITIILITHYMEEVVGADYVYVMSDGKVQMQGKPRQIFAKAEELEQYRLTIPEITKIALELNKKGMNIPKDILSAEELVEFLSCMG